MIKINGVEFEYDSFDADEVEKGLNEFEKVTRKLENPPKNLKTRAEFIRYTVKCVGDFFNTILGKDAAKKIFKDKANFKVAMKAFVKFKEELEKQERDLGAYMKNKLGKYSPNRVERRKNNFNKNKRR
ncbi:TPA: hypothetical protein I9146_002943 [Clostridium perfringens]|nr:hypothetical protein [Clostridium perfringens]